MNEDRSAREGASASRGQQPEPGLVGSLDSEHPVVRRLGHRYLVDGEPVVSVTAILGVLGIEQLAAWGQRTAVAGICELARSRRLYRFDDEDRIFEALKAHGLTTGGVAAKARALGTTVHEAFALIAGGETVRADDYPDPEAGYMRALTGGIEALRLRSFVASELVVGSAVHGYAGTLDALIETEHRGRVLLDLKTSRGVNDSAHLQLAAYRAAAVECGHEPPDQCVVLRLAADGSFELLEGRATLEQFFAVKAAYEAITALRKALGDD